MMSLLVQLNGAAAKAAVGLTEPFYNFHLGTLVHASRALDVYTVAPTLFLANDHTGHTELCSLFLDQGFRQGRNGVLLLNVPPDKRGRITEFDAAALRGMRAILDGTFKVDFAAGAGTRNSTSPRPSVTPERRAVTGPSGRVWSRTLLSRCTTGDRQAGSGPAGRAGARRGG